MDLYEALKRIRKNQFNGDELQHIDTASLTRAQFGSLVAAHDSKGNSFYFQTCQMENFGDKLSISSGMIDEYRQFYANYSSDSSNWMNFCSAVSAHTASDDVLGYWLMSVTLNGLSEEATRTLTHAMAKTGSTYDYSVKNSKTRLIRRYPTGALSEKLALMMPTIISHFSEMLAIDVQSPFLVARVLGHTGGTRDKLSALPGFQIPNPGLATIKILEQNRASYVATKSDFNPTDNRLYSLRSETDTIESNPLIVSSIASKMLACPVNLMHIDVRWGHGAFFETYEKAEHAAQQLVSAIKSYDMDCFSTITDATHPTGSFLGARGEVAEAIYCLGGGDIPNLDRRLVTVQRHLAADFTARLLSEVSEYSIDTLYNYIQKSFTDESLKETFFKLFSSHGVKIDALRKIWIDPSSLLNTAHVKRILSSKVGRLTRLDQQKIGRFISDNFHDLSVQVHVKPGDKVSKNVALCTVFSKTDSDFDFDFESCFEVFSS